MPALTDAEEFRRRLSEAVSHHEAGRLDKAEPLYRRLLELQPDHADLHHLLGVLCYQSRRPDEAVAAIERAVSINGSEPGFLSNLGNAYLAKGLFAQAEKAYRAALALAPGFTDAHLNLGRALQLQGDLDGAEAEYLGLIEGDAGVAQAYNNLGTLEKMRGRADAAAESFLAAVQHAPGYADAWVNLTRVLMKLERWDEAAAACDRARSLLPADRELRLSQAEILKRQGCLGEALDFLEALVDDASQDAELHHVFGLLLQEENRLERAEQAYRRVLALQPEHAEALNNLGTVLQATERLSEAVDAYERAVALNPQFVEASCNLGYAYHLSGLPESAIEVMERARAIDKSSEVACSRLTMLYYAAKQPQRVREVLSDWLAVRPDHPIARHLMAAFTGEQVPGRASDGYVENTFDLFAADFDRKLASLQYRAPEYVAEALAVRRPSPAPTDDILDAGCGTGLCGPLLKPYARRMIGVDLSEKMLEKAGPRGCYDALEKAELTAYLEQHPAEFDVVASADTLVYFGDLAPVFRAASRCLRPSGLLIFSVEADAQGDGYRINPSGRYCHARDYVRRELAAAGLTLLEMREATLRYEAKEPVPGLVVTAQIPSPG